MSHAILQIMDAAGDLKRLPRTGWLLAGISPAESVADHSFGVALLALALAEQINANPAAEGLAAPLETDRVLRLALLHDLAESRITDLPKRAAAHIGRDVKRNAEAAAFAELTHELPTAAAWQALHAEYAAAATPEARLVRDADKIEMAHQALRYQAQGNRTLAEFLAPPPLAYLASARLFADLLARG